MANYMRACARKWHKAGEPGSWNGWVKRGCKRPARNTKRRSSRRARRPVARRRMVARSGGGGRRYFRRIKPHKGHGGSGKWPARAPAPPPDVDFVDFADDKFLDFLDLLFGGGPYPPMRPLGPSEGQYYPFRTRSKPGWMTAGRAVSPNAPRPTLALPAKIKRVRRAGYPSGWYPPRLA
jgi:hypothetical protein